MTPGGSWTQLSGVDINESVSAFGNQVSVNGAGDMVAIGAYLSSKAYVWIQTQ